MNTRPSERQYSTSDVAILFARQGVAIETIARALVIPTDQAQRVCGRAHESGELAMMPPRSADDARSSMLAEVVNLRAQLADTQALIRDGRERDSDDAVNFVGIARLTPKESRMVSAIIKRGRATKAALFDALYGALPDHDQPEAKIIDVFICKMRRKLTPLGIEIQTLWGIGYGMTPENIAKLRALAGLAALPVVVSPSIAPEHLEAQ